MEAGGAPISGRSEFIFHFFFVQLNYINALKGQKKMKG
jgi:hypothetical protein